VSCSLSQNKTTGDFCTLVKGQDRQSDSPLGRQYTPHNDGLSHPEGAYFFTIMSG